MGSIPEEEKVGIPLETHALLIAGASLEQSWKRVEERSEASAARSGHGRPAQAFLAARPVGRWLELPRSM